MATALLVAGCGDGGGEAESAAAAPPVSGGGTSGGGGGGSTGGGSGGGSLDGGSTGGSSGGAGSDDSSGGSATANRAPTIAGTPQATVLHDYRYSFAPTSTDPDGDALTFAVAGLPSWAAFDAATGRVTGTPAAGDVGNYANIRISVSDGKTTAALAPFTIAVVATASGSAALSWLPPTANTDGTALTNLAGYRVYWGSAPGNYEKSATIASPGVAAHVVEPLTPGKWYFVVTALNAEGVESSFSNVASKTIQ